MQRLAEAAPTAEMTTWHPCCIARYRVVILCIRIVICTNYAVSLISIEKSRFYAHLSSFRDHA